MDELVECRSDYAYAVRPIALTWDGRRLEVSEVRAEWRTPEGKWFRVLTEDGRAFQLSYHEADQTWQIEPL